MKRIVVLTGVLSFSLLGWSARASMAPDETKTARGTVTAMAADSLTVKVGASDMKFMVDSKTVVQAPGAGRRTRTAQAAGAPGPKLADVVKMGGAVVVTYLDTNGTSHATVIRAVSTAGPGRGSTSAARPAAPAAKTATGTVKSVTVDTLVISGGGKDWTFAVNAATTVQGTGAGTATRAAGGRVAITGLVGTGDTVRVTYNEEGGKMLASTVRVTVKGKL